MKRRYQIIGVLIFVLSSLLVALKIQPAHDEQAVSLREAIDIAYTEATTWSHDAELVQIISTDAEDEAKTENGSDGRRRCWNILFISDTMEKQYNIFVINKEVKYRQEVSMPSYEAIQLDNVNLDSPEALKIAKIYDILPGTKESSWAVGYHFALQHLVDNTNGEVLLAMTVYGTSKEGNFCYLAIDPDSKKVLSLMEQTGYTSDGRSIWAEQLGN